MTAQVVETLLALWADAALATLLGYELPAATTMRGFLEAFHVADPPFGATARRRQCLRSPRPWRAPGP